MPNCKSCFTSVDGRVAVKCDTCDGVLHKDCSIVDDARYCDTCYINKDTKKVSTSTTTFTMPESIRRSDIEGYIKCPHAFLLNEKAKLERGDAEPEGTIYTRLGIDLHNMFEAHARYGMLKEDMIKGLQLCWETYPAHFFTGEEQEQVMKERAATCINNFYNYTMPEKYFALEEKLFFTISPDLPTVNITMDRIDEVDGMLEMTDWKTGKVMSGKKFTTDLQAPLYIHAVQSHFSKPVRKFTFVYLNEDKIRTFHRINEDEFICTVKKNDYVISIREALGRVQKVFSSIKNRDFRIPQDVRSMFFTCKMCEFKASGACRGAEEQSWYQAKEMRVV